jgi:PelA/Pel-15E family pectate lyase
MSIDNPSPAVIQAIQAAMAWFEKVKIEGLRVDTIAAEPIEFKYRWCDFDRIEVEDPQAPPIWARFYDLKTEKPIFCIQRKITTRFADLGRERRTGYSWYGSWPAGLLHDGYPAWQRRLEHAQP